MATCPTYNVLVGPDGPVVIDFPQVVSAAGNNAARTMLLRDVNNLTASLGAGRRSCWTPGTARRCGRCSRPASCCRTAELTGVFVHDESSVDLDSVRDAINDAREEALIRQQGREMAELD